MSNRVLKHYRFGPAFARINRTLRSRRKKISKIMALYKKYDLVSDGLFVADEVSNWRKNKQDSIDNILSIEKTYKGIFPHL